jgi:hypothetical protein
MWGNIDIVQIIYDFVKSVYDLGSNLSVWLFTDLTVGAWTFKPIFLMSGGIFLAMIVAWLIKKVVGI